jgi:hypothetical protein
MLLCSHYYSFIVTVTVTVTTRVYARSLVESVGMTLISRYAANLGHVRL